MVDESTTIDDGALPSEAARSQRLRGLADASFKALLARLALEGGPPEAIYERLRNRLIGYLRLHLPAEADDLADRTLDRMARRLGEGTEVQNIYLYALGIARMLVYEARAHYLREQAALDEIAALGQQPVDPAAADEQEAATDIALAALQSCMQEMTPSGAKLLLEYYAGGGGAARIEKRRLMAARLGLGMNALRNRALRLRDAMERCIGKKLGWRDERRLFVTSDGPNEATKP